MLRSHRLRPPRELPILAVGLRPNPFAAHSTLQRFSQLVSPRPVRSVAYLHTECPLCQRIRAVVCWVEGEGESGKGDGEGMECGGNNSSSNSSSTLLAILYQFS